MSDTEAPSGTDPTAPQFTVRDMLGQLEARAKQLRTELAFQEEQRQLAVGNIKAIQAELTETERLLRVSRPRAPRKAKASATKAAAK
jgi:hypothetical protein